MSENCRCRQCIRDRDEYFVFADHKFPLEAGMMIVCETCGNKRCPHATDHRHACTNSNEPRQPGRAFTKPAQPGQEPFVGIDHAAGDDKTVHALAGDDELLIVDGEMAQAVRIYWNAYVRHQGTSGRKVGANAAGIRAVMAYARSQSRTEPSATTDEIALQAARWIQGLHTEHPAQHLAAIQTVVIEAIHEAVAEGPCFLITGVNGPEDGPILNFTSQSVAEQYCANNPGPHYRLFSGVQVRHISATSTDAEART